MVQHHQHRQLHHDLWRRHAILALLAATALAGQFLFAPMHTNVVPRHQRQLPGKLARSADHTSVGGLHAVDLLHDSLSGAIAVNTNTTTLTGAATRPTMEVTSTVQHDVSAGLEEWRRTRVQRDSYESFYGSKIDDGRLHGPLLPNADRSGPILDFAIVGFAKCGTTGMMRTLAAVTTMPSAQDICTPVRSTIHYSYINWANEFGNGVYKFTDEKPLKGSKCPYWIEGSDLNDFGRILPKTNLIVGIRHPVLFFQSFVNQLRFRSSKSVALEDFVHQKALSPGGPDNHQCGKDQLLCAARARFYLSLARLGKTPLGRAERDLLAAELYQAKRRGGDASPTLRDFPIPEDTGDGKFGVPNKVFLFDSSQGKGEYLYQELARFVEIDRDRLPRVEQVYSTTWSGANATAAFDKNLTTTTGDATTTKKSVGDFAFDICLPKFEYIRKEILPMAHTLGRWLLDYFIPASHQRDDVTIANYTAFINLVQAYLEDPCNNTLVRNKTDGEYYRRL